MKKIKTGLVKPTSSRRKEKMIATVDNRSEKEKSTGDLQEIKTILRELLKESPDIENFTK